MLALSKPPYLRWAVAAIIVIGAFAWDLAGRTTQRAPFASAPIDRGAVIGESDIDWRSVPTGLFPIIEPVGATAAVNIGSGEPISPAVLSPLMSIPEGWWTVPVATPTTAVAGTSVRVVLPDGLAVTGFVIEASREDSFGIQSSGLVAVPPEYADAIGLAAAAGQVVVLYAP